MQIIDVRTSAEFRQGHAPGSRNIPLDQLEARLVEIDRERPVVLCCASGARSGMAANWLKSMGYDATNAGSWIAVEARP